MKFFRIAAPDLAIDLGTANTIVSRLDKGVVINEPTVVALDFKKLEILAIGQEAKNLIGKSPEDIAAIRPLVDGVISDFDLTQAMLEYYIHKALPGISVIAPRVTISVPSRATDVENRAIQDACLQAGARDVYLVEESLASAFGSGMVTESTVGAMVLNVGAGTSEVSVCSGYGVITSEAIKHGGDYVDLQIRDFVRNTYGLMIGDNTAEMLKITIGTLNADDQSNIMEISGRDAITGMPGSVDISASDITRALVPFVRELTEAVRRTLEKTPPELAADIMKKGMLLTGGASRIEGLAEYIEENLGIRVQRSESPMLDTIRGAEMIMKNIRKIAKRGVGNDSL